MEIKLGTILCESFDNTSEVKSFVNQVDEVILHTQFGGKVRKTKRNKFKPVMPVDKAVAFVTEHSEWYSKQLSFFVPAGDSPDEFLKFLAHPAFIYFEYDESNKKDVTLSHVSRILVERPDIKIGLVAPLSNISEATFRMDDSELYGNSNIYLCPVFGDGVVSLGQTLSTLSMEMPGCIPFLLAMSLDDKASFANILSEYEGLFAKVVFWTPFTMHGVSLEKKEVDTRIVPQNPNVTLYEALYPVVLRESPRRGAKCKGTTVRVGNTYRVVGIPVLNMEMEFGQLDTGEWVALSDNGVLYFKETIL
jgi:hypothetical protein